ncbi:hypothetical protein ACOMHN_001043 [Nucella lapillus]
MGLFPNLKKPRRDRSARAGGLGTSLAKTPHPTHPLPLIYPPPPPHSSNSSPITPQWLQRVVTIDGLPSGVEYLYNLHALIRGPGADRDSDAWPGTCARLLDRATRCVKAVESEDHGEEASLAPDANSEFPPSKKQRQTQQGKENSLEHGQQEQQEEEKSEEDKKENSLSFSNANFDPIAKRDDLPKGDKPAVKESAESGNKDGTPPNDVSTTEKENGKEEEKGGEERRKEEEKRAEKKEEEGIEKMLAATNTVVIFPESVSDQETENTEAESPSQAAEEEYILKCVHCAETFTRAPLLRDHLRSSHPDLPVKYQCPKCDDTFSLKSHMDKHLALHSPTSQQVCKVCNKTFANVYRLQRHMISHDESTDLRKFKCPTCCKAFKFKHHLKEHIRIHSGEKPFECANCGKRFSHSGSYSSHMNSKKCWVLNMKGRRMDRSSNGAEAPVNGMLFRPIGYSNAGGVGGTPLQSPPPGAYPGQFLKYDPRSPVVSTLYSPPMTTAGLAAAAAYSMLAAGKAIPLPAHHHPPSLIPTTLGPAAHIPLNCPKLPLELASSPASGRTQISPDVNSNTQLFNLASGALSKVLKEQLSSKQEQPAEREVKKEKEEEETKGMVKQEKEAMEEGGEEASKENRVCQHCSKSFASPVELHQHERYVCSKLSNKDRGGDRSSKESSVCRHCHHNFDSPIELHQHERYLCKLNKDILPLMPIPPAPPQPSTTTTTTTAAAAASAVTGSEGAPTTACASPGSASSDRSHHATPNSSVCDTATDEDDEEGGSEGKKYRMRSLINDEQQNVLKAKYRENPRPDKGELIRIATEIGFSKRVVQVWFQNMRARDRRRGKEVPYFPNMARYKDTSSSSSSSSSTSTTTTTTTTASGLCVPAYIPIVPQIYTSASLAASKFSSPLRGLTPSSSSTTTADVPLDLSVRRQPPKAHSNSSSPAPSLPPSSSPLVCQDQALNLSLRTPTKEETPSETSPSKTTDGSGSSSIRFQHSSIFKYLQQEGLFKNPLKVPGIESCKALLHSTAERLQMANSIRSQLLARKTQTSSPPKSSPPPPPAPAAAPTTNGLPEEEAAGKPQNDLSDKAAESDTAPEAESQQDDLDLSGEDRLVIDECRAGKEDEDMDNEDDESSDEDDDEDDEASNDGAIKTETVADHHNLDTLATVASQHLEGAAGAGATTGGGGKSKRLRRKSRQMESADFITDLDDAVSTEDEDGPQRKRRKSWKGHKVDAELGMYACDQCDKMFSKQSSLARHKYEHSGARPFTCEVCTKAFKHKHHLTEHRRLHSGEKPFQCKKCGKRFSHSGSYSQHMNHRYKYCKPDDPEDERLRGVGPSRAPFQRTRLSQTAAVGSNVLHVQNAVDWSVGDEVMLTPTDLNPWHTETFRITGLSEDKRQLTLNSSVQYYHQDTEDNDTDKNTGPVHFPSDWPKS